MKLLFKNNYKSIGYEVKLCLDKIDFPDFSIITGRNGSGKTHFLEAIENDSIIINYAKFSKYGPKTYFNYTDFILKEQEYKQDPNNQLRQRSPIQPIQRQKAGEENELIKIGNKINSFFPPFDSVLTKFNQQCFEYNGNKATDEILEQLNNFSQSILDYLLKNGRCSTIDLLVHIEGNYTKSFIDYCQEFLQDTLSQIASLSQTIDEQDWEIIRSSGCTIREIPVIFTGIYQESHIGQSFLNSCKDYFVRQAQFCTNQLGQDIESSKPNLDISELEKEFIKNHGENPLKLFNKILKEYSCNGYLFEEIARKSFAELVRMNTEDIKKWNFSPYLKNNKGAFININSLSSGEKVILAMTSILLKNRQKKRNDILSGVLLLDEVDTNLHPSMIKSLLDIIQNVFVKKLKLKIFSKVLDKKKVLFVWDCDAESKTKELNNTSNTIKYVFNKNKDAKIKNGIENLFPQNLFKEKIFESFYTKKIGTDGGTIQHLDKRKMQDYIIDNPKEGFFKNFKPLFVKIRQILNESEESCK